MQKKTKTFFYFLIALFFSNKICAQLPDCSGSHTIYINMNDGSIYNYDPDQPVVAGVNPVLNTIHLPPDGDGLAVSPTLNAATPAVTFYTICGTNYRTYWYYNGSTWINTNDTASNGINIGAGGGYIFNYTVGGQIGRYDGMGNETFLLNLGSHPRSADLAVDCSGNFYVLNLENPKNLQKYNSSGVLIETYGVSGTVYTTGNLGGLVVIGNDVYYDALAILHGTINGNTVNFTAGPILFPPSLYIGDMASCAGIAAPTEVFTGVCPNQLPYSWNGNNYSSPGAYTISLPGTCGDSLVTLNLNSATIITGETENVSICPSQLPYSWNGHNYSAPGSYSDTLTASGGCDSIATLNLVIPEILGPSHNINVCQFPYTWNGHTFTSQGVYHVVFTTSTGCDSTVTVYVTSPGIISGPTQNVTVCSNQLPYNWNGNNYSAAGSYASLFSTSTGCDSIAHINLIIANAPTGTTQNVTICQSQLPYSWNGNNYPAAGNYTVSFPVGGSCDSIAALNLSVTNNITGPPENISVCQNQLPYTWNGNNYNAAGSYTALFPGSNGCDSIATLNLAVNPITGTAQNIIVCPNQLPYSWNGNNYSTSGTYTVTLTSTSGCDSIATLNLGIGTAITGIPQIITLCPNQLPYSWNGNSYSTTGTYTVTLTSSGGCDSIATLNLSTGAVMTGVPQNVTICQTQLPFSWNGNDYSTAGNYTVTLTSASGCDSIATLNLGILQNALTIIDTSICPDQLPYHWNGNQYTTPGTYLATLTNANGCDSVVTVNLSLYTAPIAFAGNDDTAQYNAPYQLSGSGGISYEWSPATPLSNPGISNPIAVITTTTGFYLSVTDNNGCIGLDTVVIKILPTPSIYVPSGFTPNGDILNSVFRPVLIDIKQLNYFRVYNRYGQMIFQDIDIVRGWDGTYMGKPQNTGTYSWTLEAVDIKGRLWKMHGKVALIR